ncbi:MAG: hypothetical protein ACD_28C00063G0002 [uncultured bacterium]|nr:MAG: hypothetical protein ACD_28C00063G0002 [uncultured bacterium]KKT75093.1 MAG: 30S ribosomal protein S17 [Candidatus Peregrinibacteria bacterium GW2011_GWA2_44_7]
MRSKNGIVISAKNDKTIVVRVDMYKAHPKYKKRYRTSTKFHAHDEGNQYKEGDTVTIYESRPLSRMKRWNVEKPSTSPETQS